MITTRLVTGLCATSLAVAAWAAPMAAQTVTTTTTAAATGKHAPVVASQCADPSVDGIAGSAGPSNANPSLDIRSAGLTKDKNGAWTWTTTVRGMVGAEPGAYELAIAKIDTKNPAGTALPTFTLHVDPRNTAAPVQVRHGDSIQAKPVKGKATAVASGNSLIVTLPVRVGIEFPRTFSWAVSAINDDPNTATRFEDRCPSRPSTPGTSPAGVVVPATSASQAAVDQAFAASQLAADRARVMAYWNGMNDAWKIDTDTGVRYKVDNSYPPTRTADRVDFGTCRALVGNNARIVNTTTVDPATIQPQPGWVLQPNGIVPEGRIYTMRATNTIGVTASLTSTTTYDVHVTVNDDGSAYGFAIC